MYAQRAVAAFVGAEGACRPTPVGPLLNVEEGHPASVAGGPQPVPQLRGVVPACAGVGLGHALRPGHNEPGTPFAPCRSLAGVGPRDDRLIHDPILIGVVCLW